MGAGAAAAAGVAAAGAAAAGVAVVGVAVVADDVEEDGGGLVMSDSIRTSCATIVVALLGLSALAHAQRVETPLVPKLDPAWERLAESNARFLTKDQQSLLHDMGFALAAASGCPGFQIDRNAFDKAFEQFKTNDYMKLPPETKRKLEYRIMFNLGRTAALYDAEGLLHPREACKIAEEKRTGGPGRFWMPASTSSPAR